MFNVQIDYPETLMKYIGSLHGYLRHSLLLFKNKSLDESSGRVVHHERREKHEQDDCPKRESTTRIREARPSYTHYEK